MDLDPAEKCHRVGSPVGQHALQRPGQQGLQRFGRNPSRRRIGTIAGPALLEVGGDIVAVESAAATIGEGGRHRLTTGFEDASGEE